MFATERLVLRPLTNKALEPFAAMNADPEVMRHFPAPMSVRESAELLDRLRSHFERNGFSWLAVEVRETEEFVGCVGMIHTSLRPHVLYRMTRAAFTTGPTTGLTPGQ